MFQSPSITMTIKEAFPLFQTVALACALIASLWLCSPAHASDITDIDVRPQPSSTRSKLQQFTDRASELAVSAMGMIGIHYKYGGNNPENGLDCSGLVRYVFKDAWGVNVPRTAAELSRSGEKVDTQDLQPGDLVFYNTLRRSFSHVGIYLGDNKFIHAPRAGASVRIESMDLAYWKARFNGARRISDPEQGGDNHQ
ncbi:lecithin retinol acyltransferase family protein [Collimonas arenae]|uniref:Lecithin retinol acyltransferase family protein n=2 Tax=Collimonas arenae TaxID=279058 RepID=A0A127QHW7_9BURK|nr:lecithin retinol acyltransferase family protein [Collimonas arenae]